MPLDQAALDAYCNSIVEASSSLTKGDDVSPMVEALTALAKAAPEHADEVNQLIQVVDAIQADDAVMNKADVVYDTVVEFRDAILAKAAPAADATDQPTEIDVMLGALGKSVMSILDVAPDANKGELLAKSFGQFAEATKGFVSTVAEKSFDAGLNADMAKMDADGGLAKGMNHVAGFALLLRQLEYFLETWAGEVDEESAEGADHAQEQAGGTTQQPPKGLMAAAQWYQLGQEVLKVLVQNATGDDSLDDGSGDTVQDDGSDQGQGDGSQDTGSQDDGSAPGEDGNQQAAPPPPPQKAPAPPAHGHQPPPPPPGGQQPPRRPFGKSDSAVVLQKSDELKKIDEAMAKLDALSTENAELKKQMDALKAQPAPAKGALFGIPKRADTLIKGDTTDADLLAKAEELDKMKPEERALALIKMAPARAFSHPGLPG